MQKRQKNPALSHKPPLPCKMDHKKSTRSKVPVNPLRQHCASFIKIPWTSWHKNIICGLLAWRQQQTKKKKEKKRNVNGRKRQIKCSLLGAGAARFKTAANTLVLIIIYWLVLATTTTTAMWRATAVAEWIKAWNCRIINDGAQVGFQRAAHHHIDAWRLHCTAGITASSRAHLSFLVFICIMPGLFTANHDP